MTNQTILKSAHMRPEISDFENFQFFIEFKSFIPFTPFNHLDLKLVVFTSNYQLLACLYELQILTLKRFINVSALFASRMKACLRVQFKCLL